MINRLNATNMQLFIALHKAAVMLILIALLYHFNTFHLTFVLQQALPCSRNY